MRSGVAYPPRKSAPVDFSVDTGMQKHIFMVASEERHYPRCVSGKIILHSECPHCKLKVFSFKRPRRQGVCTHKGNTLGVTCPSFKLPNNMEYVV